MGSDVAYRDMVDGDIPYIKSTFLRSFRNSPMANLTSNSAYYDFFSPLFEDIMMREDTIVHLAVSPRDSNHIYAWCVWEKRGPVQILHYTYTKVSYRKFGIAYSMLGDSGFKVEDPFFYTFYSRECDTLRRHYKQAVYNPYLNIQAKDSNDQS